MAPIIVTATLSIATAITLEASLSFLGLGTQPPTPSWGWDLKANVAWIQQNPWISLAPGFAICLTVLGFSSITGAVNYITTVINMRAPGMTWFRIPLPTWALFITSWLLLLAMPILTGGLIMLLFDQTIGTGFFAAPTDGEQTPACGEEREMSMNSHTSCCHTSCQQ